MVAFSRQESKERAIKIKQADARLQAKQGHPDMKLKHPDWCRDANVGNYTVMDKEIRKECIKKQDRNEKFRSKLHVNL